MVNNEQKSHRPQLQPTTAGIYPEQFSDDLFFARNRRFVAVVLAVFMIVGFGLRVNQLGAESLGEDEFNKLKTVEEYRTNGLTGKNGEHPFLMKGFQTLSISAVQKINNFAPTLISDEAALRFPIALFGTFTILLLFLLISELFGRSIGLISAVLWAVEPMAVGFDRIAKEDSLALFFFLLTNLFWIRSQTAAERGRTYWFWYAAAAAAGFAGLMASKYYPFLLAIPVAYYNVFKLVSGKKWNMEPVRWLKFFAIMGVTFLIINPTVLLPDTWREMLKFSSENRIGHDSYEYMGVLYTNRMSAWLAGVPWTFYYVFIAIKTSLPILALFLIGLPLMFKRRLGDGRFFLFFWAFIWFMPFTFLGGKFTRYFTIVEPLILIAAAVGFYYCVKWLSTKLPDRSWIIAVSQTMLFLVFLAIPLWNSLAAAPHYRFFTNTLGGGMTKAGDYFPHDEFYDAATSEIVAGIAAEAKNGAITACETPSLFEHYAIRAGRSDLKFVSLSDKVKVTALRSGDFIVAAKGRRYFSNTAYVEYLIADAALAFEIDLSGVKAAQIYRLNDSSLPTIQSLAK